MAKHTITYPLVTVGQSKIMILSDRVHDDSPEYTLDNTPGIIKGQTNDGVPFMFFVEKSRENITSTVIHAVTILASLINIRKELRKGNAVDKLLGWERHSKYVDFKRGFQQFLNSNFTESARKLLYKTMMSNDTLLNIDGVIFRLSRKHGIVTLVLVEFPKKELHSWKGVIDSYGLHSDRAWAKHALSRNLDKYANIQSIDWCDWPEDLTPVFVEHYTGYWTKDVKEVNTHE